MKTIVMKFGGASVASPAHFRNIASLILQTASKYARVVIVVSAMEGATDQLISLAKEVHDDPPRREYDMLISVGERISIALLAMALARQGGHAVSFTGSQSGIITTPDHSEAKIVDVRPHRLLPVLDAGKVAIVAGFQGVSRSGEITTLGRGGSDTTAVSLGVALQAEKVEFYKDVPGVFDKDPKKHSCSVMYESMTYDQAIDITRNGAKVLHSRAVELAKKNQIPLHVKSFDPKTLNQGTFIQEMGRERPSAAVYEDEVL